MRDFQEYIHQFTQKQKKQSYYSITIHPYLCLKGLHCSILPKMFGINIKSKAWKIIYSSDIILNHRLATRKYQEIELSRINPHFTRKSMNIYHQYKTQLFVEDLIIPSD
ncbi:hypothetical protein pb186bvf_016242 [Paramecium bursaria]